MTLLDFPAVNELAQSSQSCRVDLFPLSASKSDRSLHKLFFRRYGRSANSGFFSVHGSIIRDSKRLAINDFLHHNNGMSKTTGIYKITSPSGKVYIGQSTNIENRFNDYRHYTSCRRQVRLYASLRKYGPKQHEFEIVEECPVEQLNARERYWQDLLLVTGDHGLNCKLTGADDKTGQHSEASKYLMRQKQGGANNPNYGKRGAETSCFGRKRTDAEREVIKAYQATRGRIVQQFDLNGNLVSEARIRDFAAQGHSQGNISSCCTGRLKTHHGYVFKYKESI